MREDNTKPKGLPFGADYYKDLGKNQQQSERETSNDNTTTKEATIRKDGDKIFNKRNQEEEEEFNNFNSNDTRNIRVIYPDENINQPAEVKTNHVKNNNQNIDYLKEQLAILRSKSPDELEKHDLLKMIEIIKNIKEIEFTNAHNLTSFSDLAVKMNEIEVYDREKQELEEKLKSIKNNEELKKVNYISGTNINSNKELQKSPIIETEISNRENKKSNTNGFLNTKRSDTEKPKIKNQKRGRISKKDKENGIVGQVDDKKRTDNQRRKLFTACLRSIDNAVSNLIDNIIEDRDKSFVPVINGKYKKNVASMGKFAKKKIIDIYIDSIPRYYRAENLVKNIQKMKNLYNNYTNTLEGKILNMLFNMTYVDVLLDHYLKDNKIFKNGFNGEIYELESFITFEQDYGNEDEIFKSELKENALKLNSRRPRK